MALLLVLLAQQRLKGCLNLYVHVVQISANLIYFNKTRVLKAIAQTNKTLNVVQRVCFDDYER